MGETTIGGTDKDEGGDGMFAPSAPDTSTSDDVPMGDGVGGIVHTIWPRMGGSSNIRTVGTRKKYHKTAKFDRISIEIR